MIICNAHIVVIKQGKIGLERSTKGLRGLKGSRGRPTGSKGIKVWAYRVPRSQGVGLQGPKGSRRWTGKLFFSRGGAGQGGARPKIYGEGQGREPHLPTVHGGAGKGSKSAGLGGAGAGNLLRVLIEIICCSKEISICIALSEVNLLNIHNLDSNHN